jgi:hypothetical protein
MIYDTLRISNSFFPEGEINEAKSQAFFPIKDFPRGDSLEILFSKIFAS